MTPQNVLYGVLIVAVIVVCSLLAVVLWQLGLAIAQLRTSVIPQLEAVLRQAEHGMGQADQIVADVNHKLAKMDKAVDSANSAAAAIGETVLSFNRTVARPAVLQVAVLSAGLKGALGFISDRAKRQETRKPSEAKPRTAIMARRD
ncbi:MAG TPA: hypothetical protein V6D00_04665 [Pantanalinema sp.]